MRIAHEDGETWLVEVLEQERESVAAQAAAAVGDRGIPARQGEPES